MFKEKGKKHSIYLSLKSNAESSPKETALIYKGKSFSYTHLINRVNQFAFALKEVGVKKDDLVTLCLLDTPEAIYLLYAIDQLGAVCDIMDASTDDEHIDEDLIKKGSKYLFVSDSRWEDFKNLILKGIKVYFVNPIGEFGLFKKLAHNIKNRKNKIPTEYKANWFYRAPYLTSYDESAVLSKNKKEVINLDTMSYTSLVKEQDL